MNQSPLLRVMMTALGVMLCASAVVGQSDTRYVAPPPVASKPSAAPGGYTGNNVRGSHRANVGQGYTSPSLNSAALQQARSGIRNVGQSSFAPRSPLRLPISVGSGRSAAAPKPFSSFSASPTVSPYLNLFHDGFGETDDFNYQTLVRPQLQQQQFNQQLQRQDLELTRRLQAISARGAFKNPVGAEDQSPTGHQTAFGYHSHFYPSTVPRR